MTQEIEKSDILNVGGSVFNHCCDAFFFLKIYTHNISYNYLAQGDFKVDDNYFSSFTAAVTLYFFYFFFQHYKQFIHKNKIQSKNNICEYCNY